MFLTASATSMLMHVLVSRTARGSSTVDAMLCRKADRGVLLTALGSLILGSGMALAGACPGTVLAQMGKGQVRDRGVFPELMHTSPTLCSYLHLVLLALHYTASRIVHSCLHRYLKSAHRRRTS